jgi:choline kinase
VLHILSSRYQFGPKVFGTFTNGRLEEYFDSEPLTPADLREQEMSRWIAARMAELHRVDIKSIEQEPDWDVAVRKNIRSWITPARESLSFAPKTTRDLFCLDEFVKLWEAYWNWLRAWEKDHGASPTVFAHNDTQYGNLLRLKAATPSSRPPHHQVSESSFASSMAHAFDLDHCCGFRVRIPKPGCI